MTDREKIILELARARIWLKRLYALHGIDMDEKLNAAEEAEE